MNSLPILGILIACIGGFIIIASWDRRPRMTTILAWTLIGTGVAVAIAGAVMRP
jgi:hypothetical protein